MDYINNRRDLVALLECNLKGEKLKHSLSVEKTATELAKRYNVDVNKAGFAGLMHDFTKQKNNIELAKKYNIPIFSEKTLHGHTAAAVLLEMGVCTDSEILNAIKYHTTGRAQMTPLDKIIYLADYIEPLRDFRGVKSLRKLTYGSLEKAILKGLEMSVINVIQGRNQIDSDTINAYNYYCKKY